MKRFVTILVVVFLAISMISGLVNSQQTNQIDVLEGGNVVNSFHLEKGDKLHYEFDVIEGPAIDVFIMDDSNYQKYDNKEEFQYYDEPSTLGSTSGSGDFEAPEDGKYHIVLDGTSAGQANPDYSDWSIDKSVVEYKGYAETGISSSSSFFSGFCFIGIIGAIIILILIIIIYFFVIKEDKNKQKQPYVRQQPPPAPQKDKVIMQQKKGENEFEEVEEKKDESDSEEKIFCRYCGSKIDADSQFCEECGEDLD